MIVLDIFLFGFLVGYSLKAYIVSFTKSRDHLLPMEKRNYWGVGMLNASGWLTVYGIYGLTPEGCTGLFLFSLLLVISIIDLEHCLIPNDVVVFLLLAGIIYHLFGSNIMIINRLIGLIIGFLIPFFIAIISRGAIGGGDIKLVSVMGFWVGFPGILYVFVISSLAGGLFSSLLLILRLKKQKDAIPFAPFLATGFFLYYFLPGYFA